MLHPASRCSTAARVACFLFLLLPHVIHSLYLCCCNRHLYLPVAIGQAAAGGDDSSPPDHILYRRYKLTDDRSFSSFFHQTRMSSSAW